MMQNGKGSVSGGDTAQKAYWRDNAHFADLFNAALFEGRQVFRPEDLTEADTEASDLLDLQGVMQELKGARDVVKIMKRSRKMKVELAILGIENQSYTDYKMPVRAMSYDVANYRRQLELIRAGHKKKGDLRGEEVLSGFAKRDRLAPVITVCIHYGETRWDGAASLHEMLDIPAELRYYVNDYKLHIVEAGRDELAFADEDNRRLFRALGILYDRTKTWGRRTEEVIHLDREHGFSKEVRRVVSSVTGGRVPLQDREEKQKGGHVMWELFAKTLEKGMGEGELRLLVRQVCRKLRKGMSLEEIVSDLEEPYETVADIYDVAKAYAPAYDEAAVLAGLIEEKVDLTEDDRAWRKLFPLGFEKELDKKEA